MYVLKVHLKSPQKQKSRMYWFQFWLLQRKRHRANMFLAIDPDINYLFHRVSIIFSGYVHFFGEKIWLVFHVPLIFMCSVHCIIVSFIHFILWMVAKSCATTLDG